MSTLFSQLKFYDLQLFWPFNSMNRPNFPVVSPVLIPVTDIQNSDNYDERLYEQWSALFVLSNSEAVIVHWPIPQDYSMTKESFVNFCSAQKTYLEAQLFRMTAFIRYTAALDAALSTFIGNDLEEVLAAHVQPALDELKIRHQTQWLKNNGMAFDIEASLTQSVGQDAEVPEYCTRVSYFSIHARKPDVGAPGKFSYEVERYIEPLSVYQHVLLGRPDNMLAARVKVK